ncbi:cupin domain protein [Leucosporidium creatinivorum]|uniref:Cupin domain protein n=1 Tax=Leucosporidium creatinivorum TaxID=106004 RepID=A0A1Y2FQU2_9BASI|nr:cupin domain protein [Leucosporidium creatinivorum]
MSTPAPLPALRRVVTSTDEQGKAIVWIDEEAKFQDLPGSTCKASVAWVTESFPSDNQTGVDGASIPPAGISHPSGSVFRILDVPPGATFPHHYTHSIDYGVVLAGEATHTLPDGSSATLKTGDVIVQLGNVHGWSNLTSDWTRLLFVVLPSKPIEIDGKLLEGLQL